MHCRQHGYTLSIKENREGVVGEGRRVEFWFSKLVNNMANEKLNNCEDTLLLNTFASKQRWIQLDDQGYYL